jgi:hypothetical protein
VQDGATLTARFEPAGGGGGVTGGPPVAAELQRYGADYSPQVGDCGAAIILALAVRKDSASSAPTAATVSPRRVMPPAAHGPLPCAPRAV